MPQPSFRDTVYQILQEQGFVLSAKDTSIIDENLGLKRRYFYYVGTRIEEGTSLQRFIKIPANISPKLLIPFQRQVTFTRVLEQYKIIPTRKIILTQTNPLISYPYAIIETLPQSGAKIGFIQHDQGSELLKKSHAEDSMNQLHRIHTFDASKLPLSTTDLANIPRYKSTYPNFRRQILWYFYKKVTSESMPLYQYLEKRHGLLNIPTTIKKIFVLHSETLHSSTYRRPTLMHGDMAPNNLFVFDDGTVELLDLEWMGIINHSLLATIYDYGNLRARTWKNPAFRRHLDTILFEMYPIHEAQAIFDLAILFAHGNISGFLHNYPEAKAAVNNEQRRLEETEKDLVTLLRKYT